MVWSDECVVKAELIPTWRKVEGELLNAVAEELLKLVARPRNARFQPQRPLCHQSVPQVL
jgi:hypothetical protein